MKQTIITISVILISINVIFAQSAKGVAKDSILKLITKLNEDVAKIKNSESKSITNDTVLKSISSFKKDIESIKSLKISGWIQAQYQYADTIGAKNVEGGDFLPNSDQRFMIRRGRIKFTYSQKNSQFVFQINATERGINLADIYGKFIDPWTKSIKLSFGMMNRPFGFEILQSSSDRETPERSRYIQTLLSNERDIGGMISFQPEKGKLLYGLKIDLGLYNGTGIAVSGTGLPIGSTNAPLGTTGTNGFTEFDRYKDIIGRIHYSKSTKNENLSFGIGASHYNGGFAIQNNFVYKSINTNDNGDKYWEINDSISSGSLKGKKAPRIYNEVDLQLSVKSIIGVTTLRAEYICGTQSGRSSDSRSPQNTPGSSSGTYIRQFDGRTA